LPKQKTTKQVAYVTQTLLSIVLDTGSLRSSHPLRPFSLACRFCLLTGSSCGLFSVCLCLCLCYLFLVCVFVCVSVCVCVCVCVCGAGDPTQVLINDGSTVPMSDILVSALPPLERTPVTVDETFMVSFNFHFFLKGPISRKYCDIVG
jgi:hypothetical protein